MIRSVASKVMWVGRATVFLVGLAVILALVFGVAVTALAGTGVGATFNLGKINTVNALSRLEGSTLNSMLKIDQNGSGTALNLEVQNPASKPPMLVNSSTKVDKLNSDLLDGKDSGAFWSGNTYMVTKTIIGQGGVTSIMTLCTATRGTRCWAGAAARTRSRTT